MVLNIFSEFSGAFQESLIWNALSPIMGIEIGPQKGTEFRKVFVFSQKNREIAGMEMREE